MADYREATLDDTVALMNSSNYKDRFRAEYYQVVIRHGKLMRMLERLEEGTLPFSPNSSPQTLKAQLTIMRNYKEVLEQRGREEGIDLPDPMPDPEE